MVYYIALGGYVTVYLIGGVKEWEELWLYRRDWCGAGLWVEGCVNVFVLFKCWWM